MLIARHLMGYPCIQLLDIASSLFDRILGYPCPAYHKPFVKIPEKHDEVWGPLHLLTALDCTVGGLVTYHHIELRNAHQNISVMVHREVLHESACCETNDTNGVSALTADLAVCGMWQLQMMALINV